MIMTSEGNSVLSELSQFDNGFGVGGVSGRRALNGQCWLNLSEAEGLGRTTYPLYWVGTDC